MSATRKLLLACLVAIVVAPVVALLASDEGWVIERFASQIDIQPDGTFTALEALDVDFGRQTKHGIFRDIAYLQGFDATHIREYEISLVSVTAANGQRHQVETTTTGAMRRFRIGDPNRTISGKQTYRIAYRVGRALNGFADHDELYWNATNVWPARIVKASVVVHAPAGAIERAQCYQGSPASTEPCTARSTPNEATFTATRVLSAGEEMTIATWLRKGAVAEPQPRLIAKAAATATASHAASRQAPVLFETTPRLLAMTGVAFVAIVGGLGTLWWRVGRDRRFVSLHYLTQDAHQERVPLFSSDPVVVEFEPPDKIRPGQMGLLLDERADTLDATATIIDLAVRGYLTIKELPKTWFLGHVDWQLDEGKPADGSLLEYEKIILAGLFKDGPSRKLSDLKNKFYKDLEKAKDALYADAVTRGWFPRNPNSVRTIAVVLGFLAAVAGVFLTIFLGARFGAGLIGLPVAVGGVLLVIVSGALPRRTAAGREAMRRTLGFAKYMKTAETQQQAFAERANIFTSYLPYAIVFKCVDRWARAFKDIDLQQATAGWYVGATAFNAGNFSSSLTSFSTSMSGAIASTPGGSGGSGFGGGSSGGGGGGGGGGSW
jgi:uncharacterized membrane protein YgcG